MGEEQQSEMQEGECAEPVKFAENGNEKEGSAEDDSDEDGPQLPSGLTGRHGTACFMINTFCNESYVELCLVCLIVSSFKWGN